jgi:hypothetical protein
LDEAKAVAATGAAVAGAETGCRATRAFVMRKRVCLAACGFAE